MAFKVGNKAVALQTGCDVIKGVSYYVIKTGRCKQGQTIWLKGASKSTEENERYSVITSQGVVWFRKAEPKKQTNSVTKALVEKFKESERELIEYIPEEINIPVTN